MTTATFETNYGTFKVELDTERAPITTENFINLAKDGFYDGQKFHRIIAGFMIQGGDPLSKDLTQRSKWGTGGPGYTIKDEFHPELSNVRGTISMANAGPDTGGSQFFINVVDNTFLDFNKPPLSSKHAAFGMVIEGMDIVDEISAVPTSKPGDQPIEDVIITTVTID